jgi:hypothetical protein
MVLAKQKYTRAATLEAKDFASKQQLDDRIAALSKAEANLGVHSVNSPSGARRGPSATMTLTVFLCEPIPRSRSRNWNRNAGLA